jgi:hypothetical protein
VSKKYLTDIEQLIKASTEMSVELSHLTAPLTKKLWESMYQKYTNGSRSWSLWDRPMETRGETHSIASLDGWKWISDFVKDDKCVLITDSHTAVEFGSGYGLVRVIGETSVDEFYVTNYETDYVICINHHDFIIAFGRAIPWLKTYTQ